jgi:DNA-binding FadR family transcriptional regulator
MGLEQIVAEMERSLGKTDSQKYIELDINFHLQVAKAANNRFITFFYENMQGYIEQYIQECLNLLPKMQKISLKFHRKILKAIKDRDPESAVVAMKGHIIDIKRSYQKYSTLMGRNVNRNHASKA